MQPTYLFLDTEWADEIGTELVSLALVSEDGQHRFYAERDPLPKHPTEFVRSVVYPLLNGNGSAMTDQVMTRNLRSFLTSVPEPSVIADYPNDLALLKHAISGFHMSNSEAALCGPSPRPVMTTMLKEGRMGKLVEGYFRSHPESAARRHNALVDAEALRIAWLIVTGRVVAPTWAQAHA